MPMSSAVLKGVVNGLMPTKASLQAAVWAALQAKGFHDWHDHPNASHMVVGTPSIKDAGDAIADKLWDHIKSCSDNLCDSIITHIITYEVVLSTGADPQGGTVASTSTVIS